MNTTGIAERGVGDRIAARLSAKESSPIMIVAGEAGIGKTTAVHQAVATITEVRYGTAAVRHPSAAIGSEERPTATAVAMAIADGYEHASDAKRRELGQDVDHALTALAAVTGAASLWFPPLAIASIITIVPAAREWLANRRGGNEVPGTPTDEPIRALAGVLDEIDRDVVIHLEDAQWLQPEAMTLCADLSRESGAAVTFIIELRTNGENLFEEVHGGPLVRDLVELVKDGQAEVIEVSPFTLEETRRALVSRLGVQSQGDLAPALHQFTGGRPMITARVIDRLVELGHIQQDGGSWEVRPPGLDLAEVVPLPATGSLNALLMMSWEELTDEQRVAFAVVALAERPISAEEIATCLDRDQLSVADDLDVLIARRILVEVGLDIAVAHQLWKSFARDRFSRQRQRILHRRLATTMVEDSVSRARHLWLSGSSEEATAVARRLLRSGKADENWSTVEACLEVLQEISGGELPEDLLPERLAQLTRTGRAGEAINFLDKHPELEDSAAGADLRHLTGNYAAAAQALKSQIQQLEDPEEIWRLRLRIVHHLKFIDLRASKQQFDDHLSVDSAPPRLRALTAYTLYGSVLTLGEVPPELVELLRGVRDLAAKDGDRDTETKALRKYGELQLHINGDVAGARDSWERGYRLAKENESRQVLYLDSLLSFLRAMIEHQSPDELEAEMRRHQRLFESASIPGWAAHAMLLGAEGCRKLDDPIRAQRQAVRARERYSVLGMTWGVSASQLSRALTVGDQGSEKTARSEARAAGHLHLAGASSSRMLPLLLP